MLKRLSLAVAMAAIAAVPCRAEVVRFDIKSNDANALQGREFANRGGVRKIVAEATIAVDPANPINNDIADLKAAPRDAKGRVEAKADVVVLRPERPNGAMVLELVNRGGQLFLSLVDDMSDAAGQRLVLGQDMGNGFLLDQGFTVVLAGWQGDLSGPGVMGLRAPVAKGLTGRSREQWIMGGAEPTARVSLSWPAAKAADAKIYLRERPDSEPTTPNGLSFKFIDDQTIEVVRQSGAKAGETYDLVYTARDPGLYGMGFAAVRDIASFLKNDTSAMNPLAVGGKTGLDRAIATGISQSGRVMRDMLYSGFNQDEKGRVVFEGMLPIIPGTRRSFTNARFAQPGRNSGPQWNQLYPIDQFPFTYAAQTDSLTGKTDGLLMRCEASKTCPKIIEIDSEYEFYGSRASLLVTDTKGAAATLPDNVRAFMMAGSPHINAFNAVSTRNSSCKMASSPVFYGPVARALLLDLDDWMTGKAPPPASRYPNLADGTLVAPKDVYPAGLPLPYRQQYLHAYLVQQGQGEPQIKGEYPVLLPKAGADGNALGGVRMPIVDAPRATYVGWNPIVGFDGPQDLCDHAASMVPFAKTKAERIAAKDPRLSLEELYPTPTTYIAAVQQSAIKLVQDRLLLRRDAEAMVKTADALSTPH